MTNDTGFEMATSNLRYGVGVTAEIGMDLADLGAKRVLVLTDANLVNLYPVRTAMESLEKENVEAVLYDKVRVEPTDVSLQEAARFAAEGEFDAFVAIGGGSAIDTAKAANLYSTYPADFWDYVNPPVGKGIHPPGPVKPLIAIPTTAGTGSETTAVVVFDIFDRHTKTGIAHRALKPILGILDPHNTASLPPQVAVATGLDVLSHAMESYTAIPFTHREHPGRPKNRSPYQGRNPISDVWCLQAIRMVVEYLPRVAKDVEDEEARGAMILASAYAGIGFGNAGCHLPHAMSYPTSGMVRDYKPEGYTVANSLVPHGISVILNAPSAFRFTASACPDRHLQAAELLGADVSRAKEADAGEILADKIVEFMRDLGVPNGLSGVGYTRDDIPNMVKGTIPQKRLTNLIPRPLGEEDLANLFEDSMECW